ncbi:hypothetical protein ACRAWB_15575 [Leifsonia poae]|uniref:hypothetical protein n=1 Tax=Leifsonia poae TaxID=110933 RepID=UPI003D68F351
MSDERGRGAPGEERPEAAEPASAEPEFGSSEWLLQQLTGGRHVERTGGEAAEAASAGDASAEIPLAEDEAGTGSSAPVVESEPVADVPETHAPTRPASPPTSFEDLLGAGADEPAEDEQPATEFPVAFSWNLTPGASTDPSVDADRPDEDAPTAALPVITEPTPQAVPGTTSQPDSAAQAAQEPGVQGEPVAHPAPDPTAEVVPAPEAEFAPRFERAVQPDPAAQPEPAVQRDPAVQRESAVEPDSAVEPEPPAQPEQAPAPPLVPPVYRSSFVAPVEPPPVDPSLAGVEPPVASDAIPSAEPTGEIPVAARSWVIESPEPPQTAEPERPRTIFDAPPTPSSDEEESHGLAALLGFGATDAEKPSGRSVIGDTTSVIPIDPSLLRPGGPAAPAVGATPVPDEPPAPEVLPSEPDVPAAEAEVALGGVPSPATSPIDAESIAAASTPFWARRTDAPRDESDTAPAEGAGPALDGSAAEPPARSPREDSDTAVDESAAEPPAPSPLEGSPYVSRDQSAAAVPEEAAATADEAPDDDDTDGTDGLAALFGDVISEPEADEIDGAHQEPEPERDFPPTAAAPGALAPETHPDAEAVPEPEPERGADWVPGSTASGPAPEAKFDAVPQPQQPEAQQPRARQPEAESDAAPRSVDAREPGFPPTAAYPAAAASAWAFEPELQPAADLEGPQLNAAETTGPATVAFTPAEAAEAASPSRAPSGDAGPGTAAAGASALAGATAAGGTTLAGGTVAGAGGAGGDGASARGTGGGTGGNGTGGATGGNGTGGGAGSGPGGTVTALWANRNSRILLLSLAGLAVILVLIGLFALGTRIPSLFGAGKAAPQPSATTAAKSASPTPTPTPMPVPTVTPKPAAAVGPGTHPWDALGGGECLQPFTSVWAEEFTVVDCAAPHTAQLLYTNLLSADPAAPYPGADALAAQIPGLCTASGVVDLGAAGAYPDLQVLGSYPATEEQWKSGQRSYYCFANRSSGQPLTSSVAGPGPSA